MLAGDGGFRLGSAREREEGDAEARLLVQPARRTASNKSGTAGQVEPVEPMRPINLAGGGVALAGTAHGTQAVATVTINPLALGDPGNPMLQRLMDLSVTAPFNLQPSEDDRANFVGLRLRTNLAALWDGAALKRSLETFYKRAGAYTDSLEEVLQRAGDLRRCVRSILDTQHVTPEECGASLDDPELERLRRASYEALEEQRRRADRHYIGLDLRVDLGDPTDRTLKGDKGTRLLGGLALGTRIQQGEDWDIELRGRAAIDYFDPRERLADGTPQQTVFSADWGAAVVLLGRVSESVEKQRVAFGVGVEGKYAKRSPSSDAAPTNFVDANLMVVVPTTAGNDLGLRVRIPIEDSKVSRGALVTFASDLGLLSGGGAAAE